MSRDISDGIAKGYELDGRDSISGRGKRFSPTQQRPNWLEREADHSPPPRAEVKDGGPAPPFFHASAWYSVQLIKHRDSFTFYHIFSFLYILEGKVVLDYVPRYERLRGRNNSAHLHLRRKTPPPPIVIL
jgi:hypothetical protein